MSEDQRDEFTQGLKAFYEEQLVFLLVLLGDRKIQVLLYLLTVLVERGIRISWFLVYLYPQTHNGTQKPTD